MPAIIKAGGKSGQAFKKQAGTPVSAARGESSLPQRKKRTVGSDRLSVPQGLTLPDDFSEPVKSLGEVNWLIFGETKIGKTSLCSRFPDAMFLMFEPGGKGLRLKRREVAGWAEFIGYVELLCSPAGEAFRTVIIDTTDIQYERCFDYVCEREGFKHPNDLGFGEGWKRIRKEFIDQNTRLLQSGKGIIYISHADDKEFQTRTGRTYQKLVPSMAKQARSYVAGLVDVIGYYGFFGENRYLTLRGSDELDAGHRLRERFRTPSGRRIHSVPMFDPANPDFGEEEAYEALVAAFENRQTRIHKPADEAEGLERPAKLKSNKR